MALDKNMILFGIDRVYVAKLTQDDTTGRQYDNTIGLIRLEGVQDLKISEVSNEYTLQGDNGTVDTRSITEGYEIELTYGIPTLEQAKLFKNAELIEEDDGSGNITKRELRFKSTDSPEFLGIVGVVSSANLKVVFPKVKVISMEIPYSNLTHSVVTLKAKALKSNKDNVMQKMIQEETFTEPTLTDLE